MKRPCSGGQHTCISIGTVYCFKQWVAAVKVEKFLKNSYKWLKYDVICKGHFVASDFQQEFRTKFMWIKLRILLKEEAIPSQFSQIKSSSTSSPSSSRVEIRVFWGQRETQMLATSTFFWCEKLYGG